MKTGPSNSSSQLLIALISSMDSSTIVDFFSHNFNSNIDKLSPELLLTNIASHGSSLFGAAINCIIKKNNIVPFMRIWESFGQLFDIEELLDQKFPEFEHYNFIYILASAASEGLYQPLLAVFSTHLNKLPKELISNYEEITTKTEAAKRNFKNEIISKTSKFTSEFFNAFPFPNSFNSRNLLSNFDYNMHIETSANKLSTQINPHKLLQPIHVMLGKSAKHNSKPFDDFFNEFKYHLCVSDIFSVCKLTANNIKAMDGLCIYHLVVAALNGNVQPLINVLEFFKDHITYDHLFQMIELGDKEIRRVTLYKALVELNDNEVNNLVKHIINISKITDPNDIFSKISKELFYIIPELMKHPKFHLTTALKLAFNAKNLAAITQAGYHLTVIKMQELSVSGSLSTEEINALFYGCALSEHNTTLSNEALRTQVLCNMIASSQQSTREACLAHIKSLIKEGKLSNQMNFGGWTPFLSAAISKNNEILKVLLESKTALFTTTLNGLNTVDIVMMTTEGEIKTLILKKIMQEIPALEYVGHLVNFSKRLFNVTKLSAVQQEHHRINTVEKGAFFEWAENIPLSLATINKAKQQEFLSVVNNDIEMTPVLIQSFLDQSVDILTKEGLLKCHKNLILMNNETTISSQGELINKLLDKYLWLAPKVGNLKKLSLNVRNLNVKADKTSYVSTTLSTLYGFLNELSEGLQLIKQEEHVQENSVALNTNSQVTQPSVTNTPNITIQKNEETASKELEPKETTKRYQSNVFGFKAQPNTSPSSSPMNHKKVKKNKNNKPNKPNGSSKSNKFNYKEDSHEKDTAAEFKEKNIEEYTLGTFSTLLNNKPFEFKVNDITKSLEIQSFNESSITTELATIRKLMKDATNLQKAFTDLFENDAKISSLCLRLALLNNLFKINRNLTKENNELNLDSKSIYQFDCDIIHGAYGSFYLERGTVTLQQSTLSTFVNNCFINNGFQYHSYKRETESFFNQCKSAVANGNSASATHNRFILMKDLLNMVKKIKPLLMDNSEVGTIAKHAFSACVILLGEQYARLCEFNPSCAAKFQSSSIGPILNKYRKYRNLRHGVETELSICTVQEENAKYEAFINLNQDWDEKLVKFINDLEKDIYSISDFNVTTLLEEVIFEDEPSYPAAVIFSNTQLQLTTRVDEDENTDSLNNQFKQFSI
jgi:hypothetical protein